MDNVTKIIKEVPWQVWAIGGAVIVAIVVFNKSFNSLIGQGGSAIPQVASNVAQGAVNVVSTIGTDAVNGLESAWNGAVSIFTGQPSGLAQPTNPTAAS